MTGKNVLLVEDQPKAMESLTVLLGLVDTDFDIAMASNQDQAIRIIDRQKVDLAIVDLGLEEGSGLHVLHDLARRQPDAMRVVYTQSRSPKLRQQCLSLGADVFIHKGTDRSDLVEVLMLFREFSRGPVAGVASHP
ncbi:MAG TPA: response regulator [Candidatus Aquabacterium excrementipullorum]|nr:response regulator [Candidatus Aquabacterium excrementipullorum]